MISLFLVAATSTVAEFANHCARDNELLDLLIKLLLPRVIDPKELVRKQALRGLGNLEVVWNEETGRSSPAILSALTSARCGFIFACSFVSSFLLFLVSWFLGFLVSWFLGCLLYCRPSVPINLVNIIFQ